MVTINLCDQTGLGSIFRWNHFIKVSKDGQTYPQKLIAPFAKTTSKDIKPTLSTLVLTPTNQKRTSKHTAKRMICLLKCAIELAKNI